jgi:hypothetical protein
MFIELAPGTYREKKRSVCGQAPYGVEGMKDGRWRLIKHETGAGAG